MRKAGHTMATRRIPADTSQRAQTYVALCQCGWTSSRPTREIVRYLADMHVMLAKAKQRAGFTCPCRVGFNTRKDREEHMQFCAQAPEWWAS